MSNLKRKVMNFKWKSVLCAFVLGSGMAFTSCSDDTIDPNPNPGPVLEGEKGFISMSMGATGKVLTKAAITTFGEPEEATIADAYLVFYDALSMQCNYQIKLSINSDGTNPIAGADVATAPNTANSQVIFTSVAQELVKKNYKLLVVLNPTADMITASAVNKYYSDFEVAKAGAVADFGTPSGDLYTNIVMTNASGLIDVTESQFKKTKPLAEGAADVPVVRVDRILAKVIVAEKAGGAAVTGGTLEGMTWQLDNMNKLTYWVRRMTNTAPGVGDGITAGVATGGPGAHENTFSVLLREYVYAEDPNWNGLSPDRIQDVTGSRPGTADADLAANFLFLPSNSTSAGFSHSLNTTPTHEYVLENTMAAEEQWEDVTTRILIRGSFVPTGMALGDSYYFFRGFAFTHAQIAGMVTNPTINPWPTNPTGLEDAVIASGFNFAQPEPTASVADPNGELNFFYQGVSYYSVLIRHFDDDYSDGIMNYGRYGVVRNNMYKVTLTSVKGPGKPTIPDPEGPDDKEEYISAMVEVLPWVVRTQNADI